MNACTLCSKSSKLPRAWLCMRCQKPIGACEHCIGEIGAARRVPAGNVLMHAATIAVERRHAC